LGFGRSILCTHSFVRSKILPPQFPHFLFFYSFSLPHFSGAFPFFQFFRCDLPPPPRSLTGSHFRLNFYSPSPSVKWNFSMDYKWGGFFHTLHLFTGSSPPSVTSRVLLFQPLLPPPPRGPSFGLLVGFIISLPDGRLSFSFFLSPSRKLTLVKVPPGFPPRCTFFSKGRWIRVCGSPPPSSSYCSPPPPAPFGFW